MTVTGDQVRAQRFTATKWREGYRPQEVDELLGRVAHALDDPDAATVTAADVRDARFTPTKFREGYDQDEVDDFLDRVVTVMRAAEAGAPSSRPGRDAPRAGAEGLSLDVGLPGE